MNPEVIEYSDTFARRVGGRIYAQFLLGPGGHPVYETIEVDGKEVRYYTIGVHLDSPRRDEIDLVEYHFDHRSFAEDPLGLSNDPRDNFREIIRSYGDVFINVKVYIGGRHYVQRVKLSQILENGHANDARPSIVDALERIKHH